MLTRLNFSLPEPTGDGKKDYLALKAGILDIFRRLNEPGVLAIIQPTLWTPTLTFATPGDLSVTYATQVADLLRTDWGGILSFRIVTSAFTHTTAAGNLQVTGLQAVPSSDTGFIWDGPCVYRGVNFAGAHTQMNCSLAAGSATILFSKSGDNVAAANVDAGDLPTGGTVTLRGSIAFRI